MTDQRELPVSLFGTHIGDLESLGGKALLRWSGDAEERWGLNSAVLSRNLRVSLSSTEQTESFFGALLPEGRHIERLAKDAKTVSSDLLGILGFVGADLAGALSVGDPRSPTEPQTLSIEEVAALLESASGFLVGGGGSALPGFQRKLTLTRDGTNWIRGNGTVPSTHILKPVDVEYRSSVESEHYVLQIAHRLGLAPFETWVEKIGSHEVLVIERYDRHRSSSGTIERLHQEDAGQALGLPWGANDKFERHNSAANLRAVAGLLDTNRSVIDPARYGDRLKLLRYTVLNVAAGNTDAHAKNFSLLHNDSGRTLLAPFYDAAPLALDFSLSTALSMKINGVSQLPDITVDDLVAESEGWGVPADRSTETIARTLDEIIEATRKIRAHTSIEKHVPGYIRGQAQNLNAGKRARISSAIPLMALPRLGTPDTLAEQAGS
ncbi:HipA domain-containing protein [Subtercola endophyticus]|uniref:HipA domain-containing protein n=1 Tax=Subtercola endophyticus TaxID=2895559 RepID=UPI001E375EEB|nr:HipA domain-containing protein [Subtercola endophyticus]UFS57704.1 HipA domain-containing protein [Subtercola endophyticus]